MMVLTILIVWLFLTLGWLLVAPIRIMIDTRSNIYVVRWLGFALARVFVRTHGLYLRLGFVFWSKQIRLLPSVKKEKKDQPKTTSKKGPPLNFGKWKGKVIGILRSFKVKELRLDLDTGDYAVNSILFPAAHYLNQNKVRVQINYLGEALCVLNAQSRLYKLLWAYLK